MDVLDGYFDGRLCWLFVFDGWLCVDGWLYLAVFLDLLIRFVIKFCCLLCLGCVWDLFDC